MYNVVVSIPLVCHSYREELARYLSPEKKMDFIVFLVVSQQYHTEWWIILWIKLLVEFFANFPLFPELQSSHLHLTAVFCEYIRIFKVIVIKEIKMWLTVCITTLLVQKQNGYFVMVAGIHRFTISPFIT